MSDALSTIRRLARTPGAITCGGDSVVSMGGRGVDWSDVEHALTHAFGMDQRGADCVVTGPAIDGTVLGVAVRVSGDRLYVSNVLL